MMMLRPHSCASLNSPSSTHAYATSFHVRGELACGTMGTGPEGVVFQLRGQWRAAKHVTWGTQRPYWPSAARTLRAASTAAWNWCSRTSVDARRP